MSKFITDMGGPLVATTDKGTEINIGRYGVWDRGEVIDTGDDLDALQEKHGPGIKVVALPAR